MTNAWRPDEETTHFRSQLDHFNDGGKGQELGLIRWDMQLTFTAFLTWNGQTFGLDGTYGLALAVSPCSEAAICPVLGAGTPRLSITTKLGTDFLEDFTQH